MKSIIDLKSSITGITHAQYVYVRRVLVCPLLKEKSETSLTISRTLIGVSPARHVFRNGLNCIVLLFSRLR
jgi:hypothetical protein